MIKKEIREYHLQIFWLSCFTLHPESGYLKTLQAILVKIGNRIGLSPLDQWWIELVGKHPLGGNFSVHSTKQLIPHKLLSVPVGWASVTHSGVLHTAPLKSFSLIPYFTLPRTHSHFWELIRNYTACTQALIPGSIFEKECRLILSTKTESLNLALIAWPS